MKRISILLLLVTAAFAQTRSRLAEYALVLEDPPVAQKAQSRAALQSAEAQAHLQKVRGAQRSVLAELAARKVRVSFHVADPGQRRLRPRDAGPGRRHPAHPRREVDSVPAAIEARPQRGGQPDRCAGRLEHGRRQRQRRRRRAHRHHRYRHRPESSRLQGHRLHAARRISQGRHRLHQQQGDRGAKLRFHAGELFRPDLSPRPTTYRRATARATAPPSP